MKTETSHTNHQITKETNEKDLVVSIADAAGDSQVRQVYKGQVGERVHDFGAIRSRIIILRGLVSFFVVRPVIVLIVLASSHQFKVEVTGLQKPSDAVG